MALYLSVLSVLHCTIRYLHCAVGLYSRIHTSRCSSPPPLISSLRYLWGHKLSGGQTPHIRETLRVLCARGCLADQTTFGGLRRPYSRGVTMLSHLMASDVRRRSATVMSRKIGRASTARKDTYTNRWPSSRTSYITTPPCQQLPTSSERPVRPETLTYHLVVYTYVPEEALCRNPLHVLNREP